MYSGPFDTGSILLRVSFWDSSQILRRFFGSSSGAPEGFPKDSRRIPEENNKRTRNRYEEYLFEIIRDI